MPRWVMLGLNLLVLILLPVIIPPDIRADQRCDQWVSRIVSIQGQVSAKSSRDNQWRPVHLNDTFCPGDTIHVAPNSRAAFALSNTSLLRIGQNTTLVFTGIENQKTFLIRLLEGAAHFFSRKARSLKLVTPFVNGVVEGTEFFAQVDADQTLLALFEGRLRAENAQGGLLLTRNQAALAMAGQPPHLHLVAHPRDAVQWALYYPPVLAMRPAQLPDTGLQDWPAKVRQSMEALDHHDLARAFAAIQGIDQSVDDPRFLVYRAALFVTVGRVAEASKDLDRALALESENSDALALRAIMAIVQNRKSEAYRDARQAVSSDPQSAAAHIALSYALQADFNLPAALQEVRSAAEAAPQSALAWSRMAELQLSLGNLDDALIAARTAVRHNPGVARAQTVLGFAYLTQIKTDQARQAFQRAIALDSAAPLPRLGLGLAEIRDGRLSQGRAEMEIAVSLDPGNALVRSYLGKAYFDEKREPLDERQFEIAKSLDPNDPTPWFYDAIRKQTLNRPGEALQDMQKSIALNDQRAVYRSRLLLDEDLAARSASLGRIYNDLSFQEQALRQAWKSVNADPSNFSAHRLMADVYGSRSRFEIARVSELLQSQLLQPLNITPLKSQLAESDLMIAESAGPSTLSFNEFNPLYTRDRVTLQAGGVAGEPNTHGDEITLAGLQQWLSFSAGQFHYQTDGFRENNNLAQDIYDLFAQARISPHSSLQVEYRNKQQDNGDLRLHFDPNEFSANLKEERQQQIQRVGYHYSPSPNRHFIASLIFNHNTFYSRQQTELGETPFGPIINDAKQDEEIDGYQSEVVSILKGQRSNLIVGAGYYAQDLEGTYKAKITSGPLALGSVDEDSDRDATHANGYLYWHVAPLARLDATIGISADQYDSDPIEAHQVNPKLGLSWSFSPQFTLRAAAFRSLKRSLVTNQTLEPTQVAGFNQFFDDPSATDARRYGVGLDYHPLERLALGGELTYRELKVPKENVSTGGVSDEDQQESLHRLYLHWLPSSEIAVSLEYTYEEFLLDLPESSVNRPKELCTQQLPLTLSYFHPNGFFAKLRGSYVHQRIAQFVLTNTPAKTDSDDFVVVDADIGYRLPKRMGVFDLVVTNLFDTMFKFYDANFQNGLAQNPTLRPERQVLFKLILSF